jgi:hypothetical protein
MKLDSQCLFVSKFIMPSSIKNQSPAFIPYSHSTCTDFDTLAFTTDVVVVIPPPEETHVVKAFILSASKSRVPKLA